MTATRYFRSAQELLSRSPCRLLVVGAGKDTALHTRANAGGRPLVRERHSSWLETVETLERPAGVGGETLHVSDRTQVDGAALEPRTVPDGIRPGVLAQPSGMIRVDRPEGGRGDLPGRQQSIFLAAPLTRANTTVFPQDDERSLERELAGRHPRAPDEVRGEEPALVVFRHPA